MADSVTSLQGQHEEDWSDIEQFVAEIAEWSRTSESLEEFASQSIRRTTQILDAVAGVFWFNAGQGRLRSVAASDTPDSPEIDDLAGDGVHQEFLHGVLQSRQAQSRRAARQNPTIGAPTAHPASLLWVAAPFQIDADTFGVIEVLQPAQTGETARSGSERLLAMVADLTMDFLQRRQVDGLKATTDQWSQYEVMSQRAHASLDLQQTCYQLANDGRLFVGCDRTSLVVPDGRDFVTQAISGVDVIERRSSLVVSLETLAEAVAKSGQWLRYRGQTDQLPPQLEQPVSAYADQSHAQSIDVVPLLASPARSDVEDSNASQPLVGVLVLERFEGAEEPQTERRIVQVANLSSSALRNAIEYQTLPLLGVSKAVRGMIGAGRSKPHWLAAAALTSVVLVAALWLVPATFYIEASGQAQPRWRHHLFAPMDGEVTDVLIDHDDKVQKDDAVVALRSRDLESDLQALEGDYQTTQKKMLAIASARVQSDSDFDAGGERFPGQLAAEEQELKEHLKSLEIQLSLARQQRDRLQVRSPIDGQVLTWEPKELLSDRPVQRGQLLLTVADLGGPWVLQLDVPDSRIGHLIDAQQRSDERLSVTFTLATGNAETFTGVLEEVARRTEVVDGQKAATRVLVSVPDAAKNVLRPGTTIQAKVNGGTRPLGFVWLHEIAETIRMWVFF